MVRPPLQSSRAAMAAVRSGKDDGAFLLQKETVGSVRVIFDIGGHQGETSRRYVDLFPQAQIHFFEPQEKARAKAETLLSGQNIVFNSSAMAEKAGEATFFINGFTAASSLQPAHEKAGENWPAAALKIREEINVPVDTVDDYCAARGIEAIDILKIDVQGHELKVLEGASAMLGDKKIRLVYFEYIHCATYADQADIADYIRFMDDHGYRMLSIFNLVQGAGGLNQCDLLFKPADRD
ncbi:FkbM family methyltransferase [Aestuariispira insulae]|uniref:FkbM family methyltransferase n=1 Tax=Aestuariispira insulae TaxID=1461337 RepID=A0A3D9H4U1_9PROT|nr:FkbM family methyltransferase [Aestuariispira insulae]RED44191.1 FkbM family methyltransferase [Aestuariispira insulae]